MSALGPNRSVVGLPLAELNQLDLATAVGGSSRVIVYLDATEAPGAFQRLRMVAESEVVQHVLCVVVGWRPNEYGEPGFEMPAGINRLPVLWVSEGPDLLWVADGAIVGRLESDPVEDLKALRQLLSVTEIFDSVSAAVRRFPGYSASIGFQALSLTRLSDRSIESLLNSTLEGYFGRDQSVRLPDSAWNDAAESEWDRRIDSVSPTRHQPPRPTPIDDLVRRTDPERLRAIVGAALDPTDRIVQTGCARRELLRETGGLAAIATGLGRSRFGRLAESAAYDLRLVSRSNEPFEPAEIDGPLRRTLQSAVADVPLDVAVARLEGLRRAIGSQLTPERLSAAHAVNDAVRAHNSPSHLPYLPLTLTAIIAVTIGAAIGAGLPATGVVAALVVAAATIWFGRRPGVIEATGVPESAEGRSTRARWLQAPAELAVTACVVGAAAVPVAVGVAAAELPEPMRLPIAGVLLVSSASAALVGIGVAAQRWLVELDTARLGSARRSVDDLVEMLSRAWAEDDVRTHLSAQADNAATGLRLLLDEDEHLKARLAADLPAESTGSTLTSVLIEPAVTDPAEVGDVVPRIHGALRRGLVQLTTDRLAQILSYGHHRIAVEELSRVAVDGFWDRYDARMSEIRTDGIFATSGHTTPQHLADDLADWFRDRSHSFHHVTGRLLDPAKPLPQLCDAWQFKVLDHTPNATTQLAFAPCAMLPPDCAMGRFVATSSGEFVAVVRLTPLRPAVRVEVHDEGGRAMAGGTGHGDGLEAEMGPQR